MDNRTSTGVDFFPLVGLDMGSGRKRGAEEDG